MEDRGKEPGQDEVIEAVQYLMTGGESTNRLPKPLDKDEFGKYTRQAKKKSDSWDYTFHDRQTYNMLTAYWPARIRRGTEVGIGDVAYIGDPDDKGFRQVVYKMKFAKGTLRIETNQAPEIFAAAKIPVGGPMAFKVYNSLIVHVTGTGKWNIVTTENDILREMGFKPTSQLRRALWLVLETLYYTSFEYESDDGRKTDKIHLVGRLGREVNGRASKVYVGLYPQHARATQNLIQERPVGEWKGLPYVKIPKQGQFKFGGGSKLGMALEALRTRGIEDSRNKKKMAFTPQFLVGTIFSEVLKLSESTIKARSLAKRLERLKSEIDSVSKSWATYFVYDRTRFGEFLAECSLDNKKYGPLLSCLTGLNAPWEYYERLIRKGDTEWNKFADSAKRRFDLQGWLVRFSEKRSQR